MVESDRNFLRAIILCYRVDYCNGKSRVIDAAVVVGLAKLLLFEWFDRTRGKQSFWRQGHANFDVLNQ